MTVEIPPKGRAGPEHVYRFEPPDDACNACKGHAAHRTYRSQQAADADRPHPGCHCEIVSRPSHRSELVAHFPFNRTVHDDRETRPEGRVAEAETNGSSRDRWAPPV
jgi:hypothetical protein